MFVLASGRPGSITNKIDNIEIIDPSVFSHYYDLIIGIDNNYLMIFQIPFFLIRIVFEPSYKSFIAPCYDQTIMPIMDFKNYEWFIRIVMDA